MAFSLLVFLLATIGVIASSSWDHRIVSGANLRATVSHVNSVPHKAHFAQAALGLIRQLTEKRGQINAVQPESLRIH